MPHLSESYLVSFMPALARSLLSATNIAIPEWVCDRQSDRITELRNLIAKQDPKAVNWVTELALAAGDDGKPWLGLVETLNRFKWDESVWRQERLEAILSLAVYCDDYPNDEQSKIHLKGELRDWQNRYGEFGFKTFGEWKTHWEYWVGTIEYYENEKMETDEIN